MKEENPHRDPLNAALARGVTYEQYLDQIILDPRWSWTRPWWQTGCIIQRQGDGKTSEVKDAKDKKVPWQVSGLGCSGHDGKGNLRWVGWDLDIGHGAVQYPDLDAAIADARRLRETLGEAEIRRSKSGNGIHIRHLLPEDCGLGQEDASRIAKFVAKKLNLKADPAVLGRQAFWLWALDAGEHAFEEIETQSKPVLDLPEIVLEALAASDQAPATSPIENHQPYSTKDDQTDASVEEVALAAWKPGDFAGRSPLGTRNVADVRHLAWDWGLPVERAIAIIREKGGEISTDLQQWQRLLKYTRYPRGWASRKHLGGEKDEKKDDSGSIGVRLIEMVTRSVELFVSDDHACHATFEVGGHRETWALESRRFREWVSEAFLAMHKQLPSSSAISDALLVLSSRCRQNQMTVHHRVAHVPNAGVFLDLGRPDWKVVEATKNGWRVIEYADCPVRFARTAGVSPLPIPEKGSLEELRGFLNLKSENDWLVTLAWLFSAMGRKPFYHLAVTGSAGSAKTTASELLKTIIDPQVPLTKTPARTELDFFVQAKSGYVLAYDNISVLSGWMSDALCRLSAGAGAGYRKLFTDADESIFAIARPCILNGISDIAKAADLAQRTLVVGLEPIPEEGRKSASDLWAEFRAAHPRILGGLLDCVVHGLANAHDFGGAFPRMMDAARWAMSCCGAMNIDPEDMRAVLLGNQKDAQMVALESDVVGVAILKVLEDDPEWSGTAQNLQHQLDQLTSDAVKKSRAWPMDAIRLSSHIKRIMPSLEARGISVETRRSNGVRTIRFSKKGSADSADAVPMGLAAIGTDQVSLNKGVIPCSADSADEFTYLNFERKEKNNQRISSLNIAP